MNSDQVEDAAVNAIRNKIEQEDTLIPEISVRDKTPSFDGFISLINPKIMNKGNFIGRVPVQIKGRSVVKLTLSNQRYFGISKLDLNNYFKSQGCIFFLVEIDKKRNKQIYYRSLLPLDLEEMIQIEKPQVSVQLYRLEQSLSGIIENFLIHQKRQCLNHKLELTKAEKYKVIVRWCRNKSTYENLQSLYHGYYYLYGNISGVNGDLPIKKMEGLPLCENESFSIAFECDEIDVTIVTPLLNGASRMETWKLMHSRYQMINNQCTEFIQSFDRLIYTDKLEYMITSSQEDDSIELNFGKLGSFKLKGNNFIIKFAYTFELHAWDAMVSELKNNSQEIIIICYNINLSEGEYLTKRLLRQRINII